jgi:hypothetical protein
VNDKTREVTSHLTGDLCAQSGMNRIQNVTGLQLERGKGGALLARLRRRLLAGAGIISDRTNASAAATSLSPNAARSTAHSCQFSVLAPSMTIELICAPSTTTTSPYPQYFMPPSGAGINSCGWRNTRYTSLKAIPQPTS